MINKIYDDVNIITYFRSYGLKTKTVLMHLMSKVLRTPFRIIGWMLDESIALFLGPYKKAYLVEDIPFLDGQKAGPLEGVLGWIGGEIPAFLIANIIAWPIGFVVSLLSLAFNLLHDAYSAFKDFCVFYADHIKHSLSLGTDNVLSTGHHHIDQAINIGAGTLGLLLAIPFNLIAKIAEDIFPSLAPNLSKKVVYYIAYFTGGVLGGAVGACIYPPKKALDMISIGYEWLHRTISLLTAYFYAVNNAEPSVIIRIGKHVNDPDSWWVSFDESESYAKIRNAGNLQETLQNQASSINPSARDWYKSEKARVYSPHSEEFCKQISTPPKNLWHCFFSPSINQRYLLQREENCRLNFELSTTSTANNTRL